MKQVLLFLILAFSILPTIILAGCQHPTSTTLVPSPNGTLAPSLTTMATSVSRTPGVTGVPVKLPTTVSTRELEKKLEIAITESRPSNTTELPDRSFQPLARTLYTFFVYPNFEARLLKVSQKVNYVNRTSDSLTDLLFIIEPNRQLGIFYLNELMWANKNPITGYVLEESELLIPLPEPLLPDQSIGLTINYNLVLPEQTGPFGFTERQINLGDWYPFIPPFQSGEGWQVYEPSLVGEHFLYDVADFEVNIREPKPEHEYIIAASAHTRSKDGWYRYHLPAARNFAWSASRYYKVLSQPAGSALVTVFVFPESIVAGEVVLDTTARALELFSQSFAPYPHDNLTVVPAEFKDGREYDGLYFLDEQLFAGYNGSPSDYLTCIAVHETAHQWWYGLVGNNQPIEPWLDEALATYSELLFYEAYYPELTDWWWEYRVLRFEPTGGVDSTIYDFNSFRLYVDAVYLRGAMFLEELRNMIGDEHFHLFLQDYATQHSRKQATASDVFDSFAKKNSSSIESIISSYFLKTRDSNLPPKLRQ